MDFYVNDDGNIDSLSEFMMENLMNESSSSCDKKNYPKKNTLLNIFGVEKKERYKNDDNFYRDVYKYFYKKGITNIITSNICEIFLIFSGIFFMFFILDCLDWESLLLCGNENHHCGDISLFIKSPLPNFISIALLVCGFIVALDKIIELYSSLKQMYFIKKYYEDKLEISNKELQTIKWSSVIQKIEGYSGVSAYDITNKILKNENYYAAMIHNCILNVSNEYYTKQLEFNIKLIIFNDIENIDTVNIKKKFYLLGILNLIFSPVIFFYLLFYFFISNIQEIYTNSKNVSSRRFSLLTKWKIRQYNELKHFFEKRINTAIPISNLYLKQFPNPTIEIFAKTLTIFCGICFSFNLLLSIIDENILLYIKIFDRSLLFYTGMIGAISSFSRSLIKNPEDTIYKPKKYMKKIQRCTKYIPAKWKNKFHTYDVRDDFIKIFPYKILILFYDLISVVTTPVIMIFHMTENSTEIVEFIKMNTLYIEKVGNVCKCAYSEDFNEGLDLNIKDGSIILFEENHEIGKKYDSDDSDIFEYEYQMKN